MRTMKSYSASDRAILGMQAPSAFGDADVLGLGGSCGSSRGAYRIAGDWQFVALSQR